MQVFFLYDVIRGGNGMAVTVEVIEWWCAVEFLFLEFEQVLHATGIVGIVDAEGVKQVLAEQCRHVLHISYVFVRIKMDIAVFRNC
jgi:hypothetical protein